MIVSWYQFALFSNPDLAIDSDLVNDNEFINRLNTELDWWEYQEETWLAVGKQPLVHLFYWSLFIDQFTSITN